MNHQRHRDRRDFQPACPGCCLDLIQQDPLAFTKLVDSGCEGLAELADTHSSLVQAQLLRAAAKEPMVDPNQAGAHRFVAWMGSLRSSPRVARSLPVASAVAVGLARAKQRKQPHARLGWENHVLQKIATHVDEATADLWCDIALLAAASRDHVAAAGIRARIEKHAKRRVTVWARSLEWLLVVGPQLGGFDIAITMALAERHSSVRGALMRSTKSDVLEVQQRAEGIRALSRGSGPLEVKLLDTVVGALDARRHTFPRPLDAPSSTWLASHDLEDQIRGAVSKTLPDFKDFVDTSGGLEEEQLTATLLQQLVQRLSQVSDTGHWVQADSPDIELASRQVTKKEESTTGADIGIVVDVQASGQLRMRWGDLVQVKKADALIPSRPRRDAWRIHRNQLHKLLEHSPTAAYWLILGDGDLLVVPAKYLAAMSNATERQADHLLVRRCDVRHVAVPLAHYLTDLIVGMWLGGNDEATLSAAEGRTPGNRPRQVLGITVTVPRREDNQPFRLHG
ncbi:hypothetical protein [Streptomyces albogriseolus]